MTKGVEMQQMSSGRESNLRRGLWPPYVSYVLLLHHHSNLVMSDIGYEYGVEINCFKSDTI